MSEPTREPITAGRINELLRELDAMAKEMPDVGPGLFADAAATIRELGKRAAPEGR